MQLKLATLERKTGDLKCSSGDMMPPIGYGRYCLVLKQIEQLLKLRLVENFNMKKNEKLFPFVCLKYNSVKLLNATEVDKWVLEYCRTQCRHYYPDTSGLLPALCSKAITVSFRREWITQHFQIKPRNPQMNTRGCSRKPHQHSQQHNLSCHFFSPRLLLFHFNVSHIFKHMGFMEVWNCYFIKHLFIQGFNTSCL